MSEQSVLEPARQGIALGRSLNTCGATVHPNMLKPGDVVFEEPDVDICNADELTAENTNAAAVILADADGELYAMPLKGAVRMWDHLPHGILQPVCSSSRLFAAQSYALLSQAQSERREATEHIRLAERLEVLAAELKMQGR